MTLNFMITITIRPDSDTVLLAGFDFTYDSVAAAFEKHVCDALAKARLWGSCVAFWYRVSLFGENKPGYRVSRRTFIERPIVAAIAEGGSHP